MGCARRSALETQRPAPRRARSIPPRREHTDPIYIMLTWDAIRSIIVINKRVRRELTCRSPLVCGKDLSLNGGSRSCHVTPDAMGAEMRATMGAAMGAQPSTIRAAHLRYIWRSELEGALREPTALLCMQVPTTALRTRGCTASRRRCSAGPPSPPHRAPG